ncbi:S8 family serine peptidase [Aliikangiella sp. G2MR2-5]|uniref:S8 family serine peptidase n=1 Tax=Aliikangiella sp. G2MR2-5 TaxID=2788943 RepID=UPI0018A88F8E|nr:S8 family serine peptidase [Aliikangiella sp. G2MR2-5]
MYCIQKIINCRLYPTAKKWRSLLVLFVAMLTIQAHAGASDSQTLFQSYYEKELIVKFKSESGEQRLPTALVTQRLENISQALNVELKHLRALGSGAELVTYSGSLNAPNLNRLAKLMASRADIVYAVPNLRLFAMATPNDSRYSEQWHYYEQNGGINMPAAWDINEGNGAVVAVIDTGYRPHVDLVDNILPGYDFISDSGTARDGDGRDNDASDEGDWFGIFECPGALFFQMNSSWHGTHVAGTIAAVNNNSEGVAGIATKAKILPVRVLGKCGGTMSDIQDGMLWAAGISVPGIPDNPNPAQVINLSLGGQAACDSAMQDVVDQIVAAGTSVVVAAGNSNADASGFTPASCDQVVTVASTNRSGERSSYSNYGSVVEVAAPGGETSGSQANGVLSTLNTGTKTPESDSYAFYQGTSMASPHTAGVAALLYSYKPDITPAQVTQTLQDTARSFPGSCSGCGAGIIDAAAALQSLDGGNQAPEANFNYTASGLNVSFTDASTDNDGSLISWSWDFGDGNTSSEQNPTHLYASSGNYVVVLTVSDDQGASDSATQTVSLNDGNNQTPTSSFSFTANATQVDFSDQSSDPDGTIVGWSWDFGDGSSSNEQNPSHTYAADGTYTVVLTVTDNDGASHSSSQEITVTSPINSIELNVTTSKVWIFTQVNLGWSGANGSQVDIYENGSLYTAVNNSGSWSEWRVGDVTSTFRVCEAGTDSCSADVPAN